MVEYYLAIKSNEVHATTWINLKNIMLSEKSHMLHGSIY